VRALAGPAAAAALAGAACAVPPAQLADGEQAWRQCAACHALEAGANTPAGPALHAVVGRPIAAEPGFNYSPALRRFATRHGRWTPELLDRFLADPAAVVPGTEMGFPGMTDPGERRALVAWLGRRATQPSDPGEGRDP